MQTCARREYLERLLAHLVVALSHLCGKNNPVYRAAREKVRGRGQEGKRAKGQESKKARRREGERRK
jgi:hypothetical protein